MAEHDDARAKAKAAVQAVHNLFNHLTVKSNYNGFDKQLMADIRLLDAGPDGSVLFELLIAEEYGNINGVMHGGAAGVIFDMCSTVALAPIARPGYWDFLGGVTRSLNISYLRAIPVGTTIHIQSNVVQHGRTMALIKGEMISPDGRITYATLEHHKVHVATKAEHLAAMNSDEARYSVKLKDQSKL